MQYCAKNYKSFRFSATIDIGSIKSDRKGRMADGLCHEEELQVDSDGCGKERTGQAQQTLRGDVLGCILVA